MSFDLLAFTIAVNERGVAVGSYLYYDATYKHFGQGHLPYAILPSPILMLYLSCCYYSIHWGGLVFLIVLNSVTLPYTCLLTHFQAATYKDCTEPGTRDCRYFAALSVLSLRMLIFIFFQTSTAYFYGLIGLFLAGFSLYLLWYDSSKPHMTSTTQ